MGKFSIKSAEIIKKVFRIIFTQKNFMKKKQFARPEIRTHPVKPVKSVSWCITRSCNYHCSYCCSASREKAKTVDADPHSFLDKFKRYLSGSWKLFIGGSGEPFSAPNFLKTVNELLKMGHSITIVTNFSAPLKQILQICQAEGGERVRFAASLHLEHVDPDKFLQKALQVREALGYDNIVVRSVGRPGQLFKLDKIGEIFKNYEISFFIQPEKNANHIVEPFVKYTKQELNILRRYSMTSKFLNNKNTDFKGQMCWAGSKYFILDEMGEAWRCYPAKKVKCPQGYLGNLLEGTFRLDKRPLVCLYERCYCVDPIWNRMIVNNRNIKPMI